MKVTITLESVLQLLMPLSTRNKKWLADRLTESIEAEKKAKAVKK